MSVPTMATHVPILDPSAVIPDVILLPHQETPAFRQRYLFNQPEILFVDPLMPCRLPYQGVVRIDGLGQGSFGEAYVGQLWAFDLIHGWQRDTSVFYNSQCAVKLNSSIMDPNVSDEDYNTAEMSLCFDARGLAKARFGIKARPTHRSESTEWYLRPQLAHDQLDFIEDFYFHHAIHPISAIFTRNGVDGTLRPHSILGMEILAGGNLMDRLDPDDRLMTEAEAWSYARDLLIAIKQCHDSGIAHRDIKLTNICFGQDDKLTLIDFGMTEDLSPYGSTDCRGTGNYMAPELVEFWNRREQGQDTSDLPSMDSAKLDLYALGHVVFCLLCDEWNEGRKAEVSREDFFAPGFLLPETCAFITGLLQPQEQRWDLEEAIKQCQIWGDAIAFKCNGPNPLEPLISTSRDPLGINSGIPLLIKDQEVIEPIHQRSTVPLNLPFVYSDDEKALELDLIELELRIIAAEEEREFESSLTTSKSKFIFPSPNQPFADLEYTTEVESTTSSSPLLTTTESLFNVTNCSTCNSTPVTTHISLPLLDVESLHSTSSLLRTRPTIGNAAKRHIMHALSPIAAC